MSFRSLIDEQLLAQFIQRYTSQTRAYLEAERKEMFSELALLQDNLKKRYTDPWERKCKETQERLRASQQRFLESSQKISKLQQEQQKLTKEKHGLQKKLRNKAVENTELQKQLEEVRSQLRAKTEECQKLLQNIQESQTKQRTTVNRGKQLSYGHTIYKFDVQWMLFPPNRYFDKGIYFEVTQPYWMTVSCFGQMRMPDVMSMCNQYSERVGIPKVYKNGVLRFGEIGFRIPTMTELLLAYQRLSNPPYRRLWTCEGSDAHFSFDDSIQDPYMPPEENRFATLTLEVNRLEERSSNGRIHQHRFHMLLPTRKGYDAVFGVNVPKK